MVRTTHREPVLITHDVNPIWIPLPPTKTSRRKAGVGQESREVFERPQWEYRKRPESARHIEPTVVPLKKHNGLFWGDETGQREFRNDIYAGSAGPKESIQSDTLIANLVFKLKQQFCK
jgi:hypothetical protein